MDYHLCDSPFSVYMKVRKREWNMNKKLKNIELNLDNRTFTILNGTIGTYPLDEVLKCEVLNEKASLKGKQEPFVAIMPARGLPTGVLSSPYLYVGVKIKMKDKTIIALYISDEKTQVGAEQYAKDREEANRIKDFIDTNIHS